MKASSQMVLCILYMVIYMRHTSNLEHAIKFASEHVTGPLSLDLRKIFWDIQTGKYSTIKESLDSYLQRWRDTNLEFVESFHMIEGSLLESSNDRRVEMLEKSLDVILDGTYNKMMHFTQELKNPITMLNMLGVVLPILGLIMFPLIGSLMDGSSFMKILILFLLYNIFIPLTVLLIGMNVLSKRPTGYSEIDIVKENPQYKKYQNILFNVGKKEISINPIIFSLLIFLVLMFIGVTPLLMNYLNVSDFEFMGGMMFLDYKNANGLVCGLGETCYGPFGVGAVLFSLFATLSLSFALWIYFVIRTNKLIIIRDETKKLEFEFSSALFQLGNRVGDGVPVEVAVEDISANFQGTSTGNFFSMISSNINNLGMGLREAIFGENGAIKNYPSNLIKSSMEVLIESSRKGPEVVAKSMVSVSNYVNKIKQVNERLKDLLADVLSSMKGQIGFLTPIISGIVVGISSMIVLILGKLTGVLNQQTLQSSASGASVGDFSSMIQLFKIENMIPSYHLQIVVGLFLVEIIIILTILVSGLEFGEDKLKERNGIGKNLFKGGLLYFIVAFITTIIFAGLAININLL